MKLKKMEPVCVASPKAMVGEAPVWSEKQGVLYWVDIPGQKLFIFHPNTFKNEVVEMPDWITSVVLRKSGNLLITLRKKIAFFDLQNRAIEVLHEVEKDKPNHRFNDGKCDRFGRFWVGTINMKEEKDPTCALYCLEKSNSLQKKLDSVVFSNGMCWSPENHVYYHSETFQHAVFAYDFDIETGTIKNKRQFLSFKDSEDLPDGLTVDTEGGVWCALFGRGCVQRFDMHGELTDSILLSVPYVTNCTFGGPNLDVLYITTGCEKVGAGEDIPDAGGLFAVQTDYQGIRETPFIAE